MSAQRTARRRARLLALALPVAALAALEAGLRAAGFEHLPPEERIVVWNAAADRELERGDGLHREDAEHFWLPRAGAPVPWAPGERVSPAGYRGDDPDPTAGVKVLLLGDSSAFGWGLPQARTTAALLERELARRLADELGGRRLQVLNAGVVGSTAVQGLARYRALPEGWRPDVVVEAFGAINEQFAVRDLDDLAKREVFRRRAEPLPALAAAVRRSSRVVQLAAWALERARGGAAELALARREERRAARSALATGRETEPTDERAWDAVRVSPAELRAALQELAGLARADGAALVLVVMPRSLSCEETHPRTRAYDPVVRELARASGAPLVDAQALVRADELAGRPEGELFQDGIHPTAATAERLALWLADAVEPLARSAAAR